MTESDMSALSFFTAAEFRAVELLSELIIPADERSPGALEAKVADYIDLFVSDLPDDRQSLWRAGLAALEETSRKRFGCDFCGSNAEQRFQLMSWLSEHEETGATLKDRFFRELKTVVATGFYTSEIGLQQDLRYEGNVFVEHFLDACNHPEHHES